MVNIESYGRVREQFLFEVDLVTYCYHSHEERESLNRITGEEEMVRNLAYHRHLEGSLEALRSSRLLLMILDALLFWRLSFMSAKL